MSTTTTQSSEQRVDEAGLAQPAVVAGQAADDAAWEAAGRPMYAVPPTAEVLADAAVLGVREALRALSIAMCKLPAGTPGRRTAWASAEQLEQWAETLDVQPSSEQPLPNPPEGYMAYMLRTTADYSGMNRAMLESLCQRHGIRYPLGASRAKLASLLAGHVPA